MITFAIVQKNTNKFSWWESLALQMRAVRMSSLVQTSRKTLLKNSNDESRRQQPIKMRKVGLGPSHITQRK